MTGVTPATMLAPKDEKPKKKLSYAGKLARMSDRQIAGEIKLKIKKPEFPRINEAIAVALEVVFKNHLAGKKMRVGV